MDKLLALWYDSGIYQMAPGQLVMIVVGLLLLYLAINRGFEPLLLVPIGFGGILANIPGAGLAFSGVENAIYSADPVILSKLAEALKLASWETGKDIYHAYELSTASAHVAAVQVVVAVVGREGVFVFVEGEFALGDAVAVSTDSRAHVAAVIDPAVERVIADGDVGEVALAVGGLHGDERRAEVSDSGGQAVGVGEGIERGGGAIGQLAIGLGHGWRSLVAGGH